MCPGCGKAPDPAAAARWKPFCSERCKMADLGQWFAGSYSIPADNDAEPPDEPVSGQPQ
ncbi:MAG TPA: DNA gyrase inhibitor YacG [Verrucomicrobiae bacterium]|nr:DNA gyrase inhibitor YacG [Verrucomicrobiae bacterium]